jgi:hypothetical protein
MDQRLPHEKSNVLNNETQKGMVRSPFPQKSSKPTYLNANPPRFNPGIRSHEAIRLWVIVANSLIVSHCTAECKVIPSIVN